MPREASKSSEFTREKTVIIVQHTSTNMYIYIYVIVITLNLHIPLNARSRGVHIFLCFDIFLFFFLKKISHFLARAVTRFTRNLLERKRVYTRNIIQACLSRSTSTGDRSSSSRCVGSDRLRRRLFLSLAPRVRWRLYVRSGSHLGGFLTLSLSLSL